MSRILLSTDPFSGISQYHDYDEATDTSRFISTSDAEPVLELNRKIANEFDIDKGIKQNWWWYGRIPMGVLAEWHANYGICWWKREAGPRISKLLEDPKYSKLKLTRKKHIIKAHD